MTIDRTFHLDKLLARRGDGFVKIVTGIRRCGKSFLLFNLFKRRLLDEGVPSGNIVEIALDEERFEALRNPVRLAEHVRARLRGKKGPRFVLIDEIQLAYPVLPPGVDPARVAPEARKRLYTTFYDVLNELRALPDTDVYVTGSNSETLSSDVATNFRDRGFEIRLHPLRFSEYLAATGLEKGEAFQEYLVWGGMPLAVLERDAAARSAYLKGLFERVYLKDIRERRKIRDEFVLGRTVDILASAVGSLTNPHRIVSSLRSAAGTKTTERTMQKYLRYLEESFLFSKARRYDVKGRRYLDYPEKYYAEDVGLRNARLNFRQTEPSHLMENVIYNELVARGCNVDVGVVPIASRDGEGKQSVAQHEIDFVVNLGLGKVYVQSAFRIPDEEKRAKETLPLRKSGDFFRKIVVTDGFQRPLADEDGIVTVGVIPFLLDPGILLGS